MRIGLKDIEENIQPLGKRLSYDKEFIFDLLAAYGRSPANITRLRNGQLNVADDKANEVAQKNIVYFKPVEDGRELYLVVDDLKSSPTVVRYNTRFVIVTDYTHLLAIDTKTNETLDILLRDIPKHYVFFLPWAGMEKTQFIAESHADVKAAEKMAKLFDILVAYNQYKTAHDWHELTTFFTRLLFCFFAEDTNIFKKNQFSNAIASYTHEDGSDLKDFLKILFASLDDEDKEGYPAHLADFPYVNGQLFKNFSSIPKFNKEARSLLISSASRLDWSNINPDIFGSMFQSVVRPGERTGLGQHYTSVPNIMKTIEPLFLDGLKDEFNKHYDDVKKLDSLLVRISNVKIFDPACGSGNFLIIAYKELRKLEHAILERQGELRPHQMMLLGSRINIENFYGIEIDDFAHEVAILSLWLAKHQMNLEFAEKFGIELPLIPLKEAGNIVHGNATNINWSNICKNNGTDEIYVIGNPPYQGSSKQSKEQKNDMARVFADIEGYKNLDYVACWFKLGVDFIANSNAKLSFVSTNSVVQGEQVGLLWPYILRYVAIEYAYQSFKWANFAKNNAGVMVVIVALSCRNNSDKKIFTQSTVIKTDEISPYLTENTRTILFKRAKPISKVPVMTYGSKPVDGGNLILSQEEKDKLLIETSGRAEKFIKKFLGADELINSKIRWCLWVDQGDVEEAESIPQIRQRIDNVRKTRLDSKKEATRKSASTPYRFGEVRYSSSNSLVIPSVTSEDRDYIPMGYVGSDTVVSNRAHTILDCEPYIFGIVTSRMHMVWTKSVAGRLENRLNYSSQICYNNFPVPLLDENNKKLIEEKAFGVLDARESHPEKTLAEMYKVGKMPEDIIDAHRQLDEVVEASYRKKSFESDEERLVHLFDLYERMTASEKESK